MTKPVLMIHEVTDQILSLPLVDYILTFDDGLYSQYHYYLSHIQYINTQKIFFISTSIICDCQQSHRFPPASVAHKKAFAGNYEDYMSLDQIRQLAADPSVEIGGHSHAHIRVRGSLFEKAEHIKRDTSLMIEWFEKNLGHPPKSFCFPYNDDCTGVYRALLKNKFTLYGGERIPVETLLHKQTRLAYL